MTELDLKLQELKNAFNDLKEENKRFKFSNSILEKELQEYRQLDEQGLLLKLPCKVGDRTYQVVTKHERVKRGGCTCCTTACGSNCNCDYFIEDGTCTNLTGNSKYQIISRGFKLEDFYELGKTVFLTKEEAEKALAKLNEVE